MSEIQQSFNKVKDAIYDKYRVFMQQAEVWQQTLSRTSELYFDAANVLKSLLQYMNDINVDNHSGAMGNLIEFGQRFKFARHKLTEIYEFLYRERTAWIQVWGNMDELYGFVNLFIKCVEEQDYLLKKQPVFSMNAEQCNANNVKHVFAELKNTILIKRDSFKKTSEICQRVLPNTSQRYFDAARELNSVSEYMELLNFDNPNIGAVLGKFRDEFNSSMNRLKQVEEDLHSNGTAWPQLFGDMKNLNVFVNELVPRVQKGLSASNEGVLDSLRQITKKYADVVETRSVDDVQNVFNELKNALEFAVNKGVIPQDMADDLYKDAEKSLKDIKTEQIKDATQNVADKDKREKQLKQEVLKKQIIDDIDK